MMMPAAAVATGYGARLTVDLGALKRNWQALDKVSRGALTGAAVKADAYGIGLPQAARALYQAGTRFFFVATPDEGIVVRASVPEDAHIFVLNGLYPGAAPLYVGERLMPVLCSIPMLEEWMQACLARNESLPAALHFDTGINRLGFRMNEAPVVKRMIDQLGYAPQMVMSHFACADQPQHEKNRAQLALFTSILTQFPNIPASMANSAALMTGRENHFQMVRPGIALYGGRAVQGRRNPMAPVVTLEAPVLGRVSMDMIQIDVTDLPEPPAPGDMVEILGRNITVDDQADIGNTIGYEILTSLKGRYSRSYIETEAPSA